MRLLVLLSAIVLLAFPDNGLCDPLGSPLPTLRFQPVELKSDTSQKVGRRKLKLDLPSQRTVKAPVRLKERLSPESRRAHEPSPQAAPSKGTGVGVEPWMPTRGLGVQLGVIW